MAKKKYISVYRRRREGKTDYHKRLKILMSKKPRLVIRKSLKHMTVQIIQYNEDGDKILASANTKELAKFGWNVNTGNISSAYLIGVLAGIKAKKVKVTDANVDFGLFYVTKGSRMYAVVKGVIEAGLKIECGEGVLPDEERVTGKHIANYAEKLKIENKKKYDSYYSQYHKSKVAPESIPKLVEDVKNKILSA
jgi:large subunit ribosomal protein L18